MMRSPVNRIAVRMAASLAIVALFAGTSAAALLDLTGAPVVESSREGNNASRRGELAFDDNSGTRWASATSDPQWLQVDLGQTMVLNKVEINWETANASDYTLRVSTAAAAPDPNTSLGSWTTVATITGRGGQGGSGDGGDLDDRFDFDAGAFTSLDGTGVGTSSVDTTPQARHLLMHSTARATGWGNSIWECDVYAAPADIPEPMTMLAVGLGITSLGGYIRRRRRR